VKTAIAVRGVTKTYASKATTLRVLDGVNLDIYDGEVLLLMGPSGSGKTTLLSIMGCILRPTSGSVCIRDHEVVGLSERQLPRLRFDHIGFVFQGFNLFPALSAGENVALALHLQGMRGKEVHRRAAAALACVGLHEKYTALPADLSGGQKQRVAIARALVGDPDIILADEPTAALDSRSGRTVLELLTRLAHDQERAVVIVTHDYRTEGYADRIVHMEDGKLANQDTGNGAPYTARKTQERQS